jgi:hypothetical protein
MHRQTLLLTPLLHHKAVCNGMEAKYRIQSHAPEWLWLDQDHCDMVTQAKISPLICYFPVSENRCSGGGMVRKSNGVAIDFSTNISDPRQTKDWCQLAKISDETKAQIRASSTEYLFQNVSPLIIQEAQRQIGIVFPNASVPDDLVVVHVRWGDKFWEMDLPSIQEYIGAINEIIHKRNAKYSHTPQTLHGMVSTANVYLATEDPKAYEEFMQAKPPGWNVYGDITLLEIDAFRPRKGNRASWAARNTKGRAGLIALGSLLVAMEANMFVLTTKSNWSTLMNHLRTQIIDPRCGNCTDMIDLRPGSW